MVGHKSLYKKSKNLTEHVSIWKQSRECYTAKLCVLLLMGSWGTLLPILVSSATRKASFINEHTHTYTYRFHNKQKSTMPLYVRQMQQISEHFIVLLNL